MKNLNYLFITSWIICFVIFLSHLAVVGNSIYGDGAYYYSIARSLAIDGNINFENEFSYLGINQVKTITGYTANKYPPGVCLLWSPIILLTHQILVVNNGFSLPYQISVAAVTVTATIFAVYLLFKTLSMFFNQKVSIVASLATLFMTNLFFYASFDVINSHALSFTFSSLFLYSLFKLSNKNIYSKWFILGIILGIITLTRSQDFILNLSALLFLLTLKQPLFKKIIAVFFLFLGNLLSFSPQLFIWQTIYGKFYVNPYLEEGFSFLRPEFVGVLLNQDTGLILWTPVVFVGMLGLFYLPKKIRYIKNVFLITLFLQIYTIASWSSWNQGASFGIRMLVSSLPLISFGIANFTEKLIKKFDLKRVVLLFIALTIINFNLIILYLFTH